MVFTYNITIPLTYNRKEIEVLNPDSELRFKIENPIEEDLKIVFRTYEVPGYGGGYDFEDTVKIRLYIEEAEETKDVIERADKSRLICEINGFLVDDEIYARQFAEKIVDKICKRLSLVFMQHNGNRHLYQPRVEALWSKAIFNRNEYTPFVEAKRNALEEDGIVHLEDHIYIHDSVYCISTTTISEDEIKIRDWLYKDADSVEFLVSEYYTALGTESIKSKFFHLFAIIEYCEKKYEEHNGSKRILSDDEVDDIVESLEDQIATDNRDKVVSLLVDILKKANDTGREGKLLNILKWMGITDYKRFGEDKIIDKKLIEGITKLRNKSFHGTKEKADAKNVYAGAVEKLLYIDEQILHFVMNENRVLSDTDGTWLITGKR